MNNNSLCRFLFFACLVILLPAAATAKQWANTISDLPDLRMMASTDSTSKKQRGNPDDKKEDVKKTEIKEVPKSKRQLKPVAVGTKIKIKIPVKIRPIIKRPAGLIRKTLGI